MVISWQLEAEKQLPLIMRLISAEYPDKWKIKVIVIFELIWLLCLDQAENLEKIANAVKIGVLAVFFASFTTNLLL